MTRGRMRSTAIDLARYNPAEPRDAHGRWTKSAASEAEDESWRMDHRPAAPGDDVGSPMHDLTGTYPADFYDHPNWYAYEDGSDESVYQMRKAKGNPEAKIRIYRSMPAEYADRPLQPGDWVSTSEEYARGHGKQENPADDWPVMRYTTLAKHLYTSGDSVNEWGYWEENPKGGLPIFKGGRNQEVRIHEDGVTRKVKRRKKKTDLSVVDLAVPQRVERHVVGPAIDHDTTVRHIAKILKFTGRGRHEVDSAVEARALRPLLAPYGVNSTAIRMALGLTHTESGRARGTQHLPNAILNEHGAELKGMVRDVRDHELFFRASYLANAAQRMQESLDKGLTQRDALRAERTYYQAHERARKGRLKAAAQVQTAAGMYGQEDQHGTLVGWYLNPLLNNEVECQTANGHNFYAEDGTVIGLPGSVHANCGCYAGPPITGAAMVNDMLGNVIKFGRSKPKFKLKGRKYA